MRILVTCPPMLGMMDELGPLLDGRGWEVHRADVVQTLSEEELIALVPGFEGWIIGDDPATERVLEAGVEGRLRAAVKWGVGVDNVDFEAARRLGLPVENTPGMFGNEVADVAMSYVTALARETFVIDRGVRAGLWPKPRGISLAGKTMGLVGHGDIGRATARRARAAGMELLVYDPVLAPGPVAEGGEAVPWPERLDECHFLVFTCALTERNRHMLDATALAHARAGVRVVNVARGPLIDTAALVAGLESGRVHSAALDVMEEEPLPADSPLRRFERCVFGSHNASNTGDAVRATTQRAVEILARLLDASDDGR